MFGLNSIQDTIKKDVCLGVELLELFDNLFHKFNIVCGYLTVKRQDLPIRLNDSKLSKYLLDHVMVLDMLPGIYHHMNK